MNQANLSRFVQLFTLSDANATQRVSERLALVLRDPAAYQEQFAEELEERGIMAALPAQELCDLALIDALLSEELLWESDWKDPAADLVDGINETLTQQKRTVRLNGPATGRGTVTGPEALDIVQDLAEPVGLAFAVHAGQRLVRHKRGIRCAGRGSAPAGTGARVRGDGILAS